MLLLTFLQSLPPVLLGILVIIVVIFIIKSLLKFAIIAGAIALVVFLAWQMHWIGR